MIVGDQVSDQEIGAYGLINLRGKALRDERPRSKGSAESAVYKQLKRMTRAKKLATIYLT
jgi:hypothetical protein